MASATLAEPDIARIVIFLKPYALNDQEAEAISKQLRDASTVANLVDKLEAAGDAVSRPLLAKLKLLRLTLEISNNLDLSLVVLSAKPESVTLADVAASHFDPSRSVRQPDVPPSWKRELYRLEPTAVILYLATNNAFKLSSEQSGDLQQFFRRLFDLGLDATTTPFRALEKAVSVQPQSETSMNIVKSLLRLNSTITSPNDLGPLLDAGFTSAQSIATLSQDTVREKLSQFGVDSSVAAQIHSNATTIALRNDHAWAELLRKKTETLIPAVRKVKRDEASADPGTNEPAAPNFAQMFKELDAVDCMDCQSVLSPAAYLVDLLQTLRLVKVTSGVGAISLLDKLLDRRPDLINIELTCENTNTPIPTIDLANEVMEAYLTTHYAAELKDSPSADMGLTSYGLGPRGLRIYEDLIQPKCFPMDAFPYNYGSDLISTILRAHGLNYQTFLEVFHSEYRILDTYLPPHNEAPFSRNLLELARAMSKHVKTCAELNLQAEDFLCITHERFWGPKFVRACNNRYAMLTDEDYTTKVARYTSCTKYWGYDSDAAMLDAQHGTGLGYVRQVLDRAQIGLDDLVAILKTDFIGGRLTITSSDGCDLLQQDISLLRLRASALVNEDGSLSLPLCDDLQVFIRLLKRTKLSISTLSACLAVTLQFGSAGKSGLRPAQLDELAALVKLAKSSHVEARDLAVLWADDLSTSEPTILARLKIVATSIGASADDIHRGRLTFPVDSLPVVAAAMRVPIDDALSIAKLGSLSLSQPFTLADLSLIYRVHQLCEVTDVTVSDLESLMSSISPGSSITDILEAPSVTLDFHESWQLMKQDGWSLSDLEIVRTWESSTLLQQESLGTSFKVHSDFLASSGSNLEYLKGKYEALDNSTVLRAAEACGLLKALQWSRTAWSAGIIADGYILAPASSRLKIVFGPGTLLEQVEYTLGNNKLNPTTDERGSIEVLTPALVQDSVYKLRGSATGVSALWVNESGMTSIVGPESFVPADVFLAFASCTRLLDRIQLIVAHYNLDSNDLSLLESGALTPGETGPKKVPDQSLYNLAPLPLKIVNAISTYTKLKMTIARNYHQTLVDFIKGASKSDMPIAQILAQITGWKEDLLAEILVAKYPRVAVRELRELLQEPSALLSIKRVMEMWTSASIPGATIDALFRLAEPVEDVSTIFDYARDMQNALYLKSTTDVNDSNSGSIQAATYGLRESRRRSLISYLLGYTELSAADGITTADGLFEYFLIDVNTGPIPETSRIQQAIATIQLYVQRCLLGLEQGRGVPQAAAQDIKSRWNTIGRYTLWEANRKVFLFPENWLEPTLRGTKTPEFQALEASIMQNELTRDSIDAAIRQYVYSVNAVGNLEIQAYLWDKQDNGRGRFHFFGRTRAEPYQFYHRTLDIKGFGGDRLSYWNPWAMIDIGTPLQMVDSNGEKPSNPGAYLIPALVQGRLLLFSPEMSLKTVKPETAATASKEKLSGLSFDDVNQFQKVERRWEIKLAWVEYRNGKWSPRSVSADTLTISPKSGGDVLPPLSSFRFRLRARDRARTMPEPVLLHRDNSEVSSVGTKASFSTGVDGILIIDVESWQTQEEVSVPIHLGQFELRDSHLAATSVLPATFKDVQKPKTLPTRYGKLEWAVDPKGRAPDVSVRLPPYEISEVVIRTEGSQDTRPSVVKPLLVDVQAQDGLDSMQPRDLRWTLMMDDAHYSRPIGLVVDVATTSTAPRAYFARPPRKELTLAETSADLSDSADISPLYNSVAPKLVSSAMTSDTLGIFNTLKQQGNDAFAFGLYGTEIFHELFDPNSIYNWELGVHLVSLLMERLYSTQQFDLAIEIANLLFDPTLNGASMEDCWTFPPFASNNFSTSQSVKDILVSLKPQGTGVSYADLAIAEWKANPFDAHSVARTRPVAYMKRIVLKYIETLIASGDVYFRQGSVETLPLAMQKYIQALHIFGQSPMKMRPISKPKGTTYRKLISSIDNFANAAVELELEFPYSCLRRSKGLADEVIDEPTKTGLLGFLATTYFCVPQNPQIEGLRGLLDDRLAKIRASQDINGKFRKLPLFDPAIDPGALVKGFSSGQGLAAVADLLDEQTAPMPNYRFTFLIRKALEMTLELRYAADTLLSAREKRDVEALALLKSQQERNIHSLVLTMKQTQKEEAEQSLEVLQDQKDSQEARLKYYLELIGEDKSVPNGKDPWIDVHQSIAAPTKDDLRMSPEEKLEFDKFAETAQLTFAASMLETTAGGLQAVPNLSTNAQPMGMGTTVKIDAENIAKCLMGAATVLKLKAQLTSDEAHRSSRKAQLKRQLQDRRMQANQAGRDFQNVLKQIEVHKLRIKMSEINIKTQEITLKHTQDTEEWYKQKYTGVALYAWMENSVRSLLYQNYTAAMDLARKVETSFKFERALHNTAAFIEPRGYWNSAHSGLLSAQSLILALKKMEAAHMDGTDHDFEIKKEISLRQINAGALLRLRAYGKTEFNIDELLFDLDFPGHYLRRIKTVTISIPCVTGPYVSLNATLTLTAHKYRINEQADRYTYMDNDRSGAFRSDKVPITTIAISERQSDSGRFDLSFGSDRYLPFENAGAVSSWSLELPPTDLARFDYGTISDVILHLRYTSRQGGAALQKAAIAAVQSYIGTVAKLQDTEGLFALIDLSNECSNGWNVASMSPSEEVTITMGDVSRFLPYWARTKRVRVDSILVALNRGQDREVVSTTPPVVALSLISGESTKAPFTNLSLDATLPGAKDAPPIGWSVHSAKAVNGSIGNWVLVMKSTETLQKQVSLNEVKDAYLLFRYILL